MGVLRKSIRFSALLFGLVLVFGGAAIAQTGAGGPINGGGSTGELLASIPDVTVAPSSVFELQLIVTDPTPLPGIILMATTDPTQVQFLSATQGAGVLAYLDANGEPPQCDIITDPMSVFGLIFFGVPYETAVYGTEMLVITAVAPATPGSYSIDSMVDSLGLVAAGSTTVTVSDGNVPPKDLVRGDVNDDGGCNISDPVSLLAHLFNGGEAPNCFDAADVDDSGSVDISDAINLLSGIFGTGFDLDESCGPDSTDDSLGECDRADCVG